MKGSAMEDSPQTAPASTATTLASKLADWGEADLSARERTILINLVWRHADPLDRVRISTANVLDETEESLVRELELEFRRPE